MRRRCARVPPCVTRWGADRPALPPQDRCAAATVLAQLRGTAQAGGDSVAAAARESAQGVQGELGAAKSEGAGAVEAARGTAAAQRDETLALLSSFAAAVLASRQEVRVALA